MALEQVEVEFQEQIMQMQQIQQMMQQNTSNATRSNDTTTESWA